MREMVVCRLACSDVRLDRLPGWELNSWGYHGDDGSAFAGEREGEPFGPKFTSERADERPRRMLDPCVSSRRCHRVRG